MKLLSKAAYALLTDDAKKEYDAALLVFIAEFKELADGSGLCYTQANITRLSAIPKKQFNGRMAVVAVLDIPDTRFAGNIAGTTGNRTLHPAQADVIAQGGGFANWQHFAVSTLPCIEIGSFNMGIKLNEKGESWKNRKTGKTGIFTNTHLAVVSYEYLPSVEVNGLIAVATKEACSAGFSAILNMNSGATPVPVAVEPEAEGEPEVKA